MVQNVQIFMLSTVLRHEIKLELIAGPGSLRAHSAAQGCHGQPGEHRQVPRRLLPGAHREQGQREHQLLF